MDDCWLYEEADNGRGYQRLWLDGRLQYLHVWSWETYHGRPVPDGLEIDHLCGVVNCWNPDHLEAVTHAENMARKHAKITHCPAGHSYAEHGVVNAKTRRRNCRMCMREASRRYREKKRALVRLG